ncbi:MAG: LPS export ABC transporter periplasmic protein LptC [Bacteroidaceae bacterium]|nr:LPS export ABC transporter periplasmic protein LptC [Bacteroidaceae bacterium]
MKKLPFILVFLVLFMACEKQADHSAAAVNDKDSASMMVSWGINTLISDSGVIRYRMVTERWEVNTVKNPTFWYFDKGLFLEQFDEKFKVQAFIECDTAWYFDQQKLWELRGNVKIRTTDGTRFASEELYWNQLTRKIYSNKYSWLKTPEYEMEGTYFESDEPDNFGRLNHYKIDNSKGFFRSSDVHNSKNDTISQQPDSIKKKNYRTPLAPRRDNSAAFAQPDTAQKK